MEPRRLVLSFDIDPWRRWPRFSASITNASGLAAGRLKACRRLKTRVRGLFGENPAAHAMPARQTGDSSSEGRVTP
jgi:hypothetical protein